MPPALRIPDAKAAVDKEWNKLQALSAWNLDKMKCKKEVDLEAQREKKVHFASLMDICHLKKFGVGTKIRRLWSLCSSLLNKARLRHK